MKKYQRLWVAFLVLLLSGASHCLAQPVSEAEALQTARRFVSSRSAESAARRSAAAGDLKLSWASAVGTDAPELYVFNMPMGGFVIVSGDEGTEREILGWSDAGTFDADRLPDALQFLVNQYAKGIDAYRKDAPSLSGTAANRPRRAPSSGYGTVKPLLKTTWGQDIDLYGHRYAGCVATALAGILNYHRWPKQGYGSHTNFWDASHSIDFTQSSYAWGNMDAEDHEKREAARQKLLNDIGCAVNMHYDQPNGSEAYTRNAYKALVTNFGYDESRVVYGYASDSKLRDELRAGRPVYYAGNDTVWTDVWVYDRYMRLPQNTVGHAMIIDGFSDDGLFHIDFGWDGSCNGYFTMSVIRPYGENDKTYSFAPFGEMIYGITPQKSEKVKIGDIWYNLDHDASSAIVASSLTESYSGDIAVPPTVDYEGKTYAVNAMYGNAFLAYVEDTTAIRNLDLNAQIDSLPANIFGPRLEGIAIRGNIASIPDFAFENCSNLQRVVIGDKVKTIGRGAFRQCDIHELTLGSSVETIGEEAFSNGSVFGLVPKNLTALELPASLKEIGKEAFWGSGIEKLTLPAGVKCGRGAFGQCYSLSELTISEGVTEIADSCFIYNGILTLDVPASVTRIGRWGLSGSKMFRIRFHSPSFVIDEHAISSSYFEPIEGLEGCTSIGSEGLRGLTGTFTVNPNTTYADNAVIGNFDKIIIPAAAADYNPQGVTSAKYYQVESGHPTLSSAGGILYNQDFSHLYILPNFDDNHWDLYIPRSVKTISGQPFEKQWLRVWLPEGLQSIDARWIDGLDLRDVYCPAAVPPVFLQQTAEGIASPYMNYHARLHVQPGCAEAYKNAPGWKDIPNVIEDLVLDDGFVYQTNEQYDQWEKRTYYWAEAISHRSEAHPSGVVMVPSFVKVADQHYVVNTINPAVFQADVTLKEVTLGSFVSFVYDNAFRCCENLRRVTLGEKITSLSTSTFEGCTALEEVIFKAEEVTEIPDRAFFDCASLRTLNLPPGIRSVGESAFEGCASLKTVRGIQNVRNLPDRLFARSGIESFTVGKDMYTTIYKTDNVFADCPNLHTLDAHPENTQFKSLDGILYSIYYDGTLLLYQCPPRVKLESGIIADREVVNFSEELSQLMHNALPASTREVILPASLTQMSWQACALADKLTKVTCLFTDPAAGSYSGNSFHPDVYATATLQVPKGSKEKFQSHYEFRNFKNIVEIDPADYPSPEQILRDKETTQEDDPTVATALTLLLTDGTTHTVRLTLKPVMSIDGSNLTITGRSLSLSLPLSNIIRYTFETYDATGIDDVKADQLEGFDMQGDELIVSGLEKGAEINVFDLAGKRLRHDTAAANGRLSLSLSGLPAGVYIVKVNQTTYKITKQ